MGLIVVQNNPDQCPRQKQASYFRSNEGGRVEREKEKGRGGRQKKFRKVERRED